jgi:membrane fusion protein, multidrug efflux system
LVTEGNLINGGTGGTLLTTVVSLDPIYCYAEADEQSFLKYTRLAREGKRPSSREVRNPAYLALGDEKALGGGWEAEMNNQYTNESANPDKSR